MTRLDHQLLSALQISAADLSAVLQRLPPCKEIDQARIHLTHAHALAEAAINQRAARATASAKGRT